MDTYPEDLLAQIKNYISENRETYDEDKIFFYIDCTVDPLKLVFEKWLYDFKPPVVEKGVLRFPKKSPPKNE